MDELTRIPPQNLDAEQVVIGKMLLFSEAITHARAALNEADFYREAHRLLFREIVSLFNSGVEPNIMSLGERLNIMPAPAMSGAETMLQHIGSTLYLTTCIDVSYMGTVEHACKILRTKSLQRSLIHHCDSLMQRAYEAQGEDVETLLRDAEGSMMQLSDWWQGDNSEDMVLWGEAERLAVLARREADKTNKERGHQSPLSRLNNLLMPIRPGDFTILAGRPSTGKTSLAVQWAYYLASAQKLRGLFVSIEMTKEALAMRRLRAATGYSRWSTDTLVARTGYEGRTMYEALDTAVSESADVPLLLMDVPVITPDRLLDAGRRARRRLGGLDFIVVDYVQKMDANRHYAEDTPRVASICRDIKRAAKRLECNLIGLSQINREGGKQRPTMNDLRDSGWLEQEADQIILLHFPDRSNKREIEIGLEKQRDGGTGWATCGFDERTTWFYDSPNDVPERGQAR